MLSSKLSNENKKLILGLVGQIASGKGSVSEHLRTKYKANFYHFSTPLRKTLKILKLDEDRQNLAKLSKSLRKSFGEDLLARVITSNIKNDKSKIIVVDSVRRMDDIKYLQDLPEFRLVYIKANIKTRYERLTGRRENKDDKIKTYKEFVQDNKLETEIEIAKISKKAEFVIDNSGSLDELHKQIDEIIKSKCKN